jgi:antirestriction protein
MSKEIFQAASIVSKLGYNGATAELALGFVKSDRFDSNDEAVDAFEDRFQGAYYELTDFYIEHAELLTEGVSDDVMMYFDYERYGRDLFYSGQFYRIELSDGRTAVFRS